MRLRLLASASALSLLAMAPAALAGGEGEDRFATEVLLGPTLSMRAPTSPSYVLGVGEIRDPLALGLDTIITGQIANPDAAEAASRLTVHPVLSTDEDPVETHEGPSPAEPAQAAGHGAEATGHGAEAAGHGAKAAAHGAEAGAAAPEQAAPAAGEAPPAHGEPAAADHAEAGHDPVGASAFPTERGPEPFDIIRTIQFLQDQVSRGNGRAIRVQAALLRRFGPVFLQADRKVWADKRNMRAAVLFVLSGGPPEVLKRLLDAGDLDDAQRPLFEGALAYVRNDLDGAAKRLAALDLAPMEPGLAAHIHLVLGQVLQTKDRAAAIRHLDQARLLAPGGLIEEAALRMEVLIVEDAGDHAAADRLARQYFDRYARSSYSGNFEARFALVYAGRGGEHPEAAVATILDVTARLPDADRGALLLAVARRSLVDGKLELAEHASDAARALGDVSPPERQRADLYAVAARLGRTPTNEAARLLDAVDRNDLHPEDVKLLEAAHSVVAGIERSVDPAASADAGQEIAESSPVFDRAQKLLSEVSDDLGKATP